MFGNANRRRWAPLWVCLVLAGTAACGAAGDWPIYRGPDRNGISKETGWHSPGAEMKVLWTAQVTTGCSSLSVADGRLYTMGNKDKTKDTVYCFDAVTGKELWTYSYDCPRDKGLYEGGPNSTPTVVGGRVYTFSRRGHVFCLDAVKGTKIWGVQLKVKVPTWGLAGSPLVLDKRVFLNAGSAGMALDKDTGKVVWDSGAGPGGYSTPVAFQAGGKTLLTMFGEQTVLAVQADDGKKVWEHPWKTSYHVNAGDPVVIDGGKKVFISSGYNKGCALLDVSGATPRELWRNRNMRNHRSCSILYKGALYGFDESALTCLDLATGKTKWAKSGLGKATVALADGKLIVLAERGKVVLAEATPEGFKELASGQAVRGACWAVPVLANGRIYARSKGGKLACVTFSGK